MLSSVSLRGAVAAAGFHAPNIRNVQRGLQACKASSKTRNGGLGDHHRAVAILEKQEEEEKKEKGALSVSTQLTQYLGTLPNITYHLSSTRQYNSVILLHTEYL